jgi:hypothetical protein
MLRFRQSGGGRNFIGAEQKMARSSKKKSPEVAVGVGVKKVDGI